MAIVLNGNTGIQNVLGSASAPAESNTTSTNVGLYFPTSTTLGLATGGASALYIDASQNVGIGTVLPSSKLSVSGTATLGVNYNDGTRIIALGTSSTTPTGGSGQIGTTTNHALTFLTNNTVQATIDTSGNVGIGTSLPSNKLSIQYTDSTAWVANSTNSSQLVFNNAVLNGATASTLYQVAYGDSTTGGVKVGAVSSASYSADFVIANRNAGTYQENMRVTYNGNVGIGTSSPATALSVQNVRSDTAGTGWFTYTASATAGKRGMRVNTNNGFCFDYYNGSAWAEQMQINSSGNVGIGTSNVPNKLTVSNAGANGFEFDPTNSIMQTYNRSTSAYTGMNILASTFAVKTGASPSSAYLFVDSSGNVGIGTSSPNGKLELSGTGPVILRLNDTVTNFWQLESNSYLAFNRGGTERMRITSNGGVSFGSSGTAYGTSGQVLQSNGDAPPSWGSASATGTLIRAPQILTSGTSYTTPSNCTKIYVEAVGGGGSVYWSGTTFGNSGGGGGGYCAKYFTVTGSTAYTYAVGAGGAASTLGSPTGKTGGSTTFTVGATTITAGGGQGGTQASGSIAVGGAGGTSSNGDLNIAGGDGGAGINGNPAFAGYGGASMFGGSAGGVNNASPGQAGKLYGGGAGGTGVTPTPAGAQGVIRIWEFT